MHETTSDATREQDTFARLTEYLSDFDGGLRKQRDLCVHRFILLREGMIRGDPWFLTSAGYGVHATADTNVAISL